MQTVAPPYQLRINEIFHSIQGEGAFHGTPATFIRFQGCSVGCSWCDTKHTWDFHGGTLFTIDEVVAALRNPHIVLTGGEPGQQPRRPMSALVQRLRAQGHRLQLETSGRFYAPWMDHVDWRTLSPKPPTYAVRPELKRRADEWKVVVDEGFTERIVPEDLPPDCIVYLQPEGNKPPFIHKALDILKRQPHWRLSLQTHKMIGLA